MGGTRLDPPRTDLTVVELDGRVSVLAPATGTVHTLNMTATDVWRLLDGSRSVEDVVDSLLERYDVERGRLLDDVLRVVADLSDRGLLEPPS